MLGIWCKHIDYQKFVISELVVLSKHMPDALKQYENCIAKLFILNLDVLKELIAHLYSHTGAPALFQPEIFRAFVIMSDLGIRLNNLVDKISSDYVLRTIAGFSSADSVKTSSLYDFINRIFPLNELPELRSVKKKPRKKLQKGEKLPEKHPGIIEWLVNKILEGERFDNRPEITIQTIFAKTAVQQSIALGLIPEAISVSGDGTCMNTGASPYGTKTCKCTENGIYHCDCPRKFSDPNATWGWDSSKEVYFYGYHGYFISIYNPSQKIDLPIYIRLVEARRHDSVSAVVALAEWKYLYPSLKIETFISDSASDNYATYKLLHAWSIQAVIALNKKNTGKTKYPNTIQVDENGIPFCMAGYKMRHYGYCLNRSRIKWRCPVVLGKAERCEICSSCSPSHYGRVVYTKPAWDLRLFTVIPRGSDAWKNKMKQRTAAERINNRILNHYHMEHTRQRGKKRITFFTTMAAINIHLDAQINFLKSGFNFDFLSFLVYLFEKKLPR